MEIISKNGQRLAKVEDLHPWADNPRQVHKDDAERLKRQFELGEHSTLLVMPDGTTLGGNTRVQLYKTLGKEYAKVVVVDIHEADPGTWVADVDGQRATRTFDTKEQGMLEYALSHNDQIGKYDDVKLAELVHLTPITANTYKVITFTRLAEDVAFEAGPTPEGQRPTSGVSAGEPGDMARDELQTEDNTEGGGDWQSSYIGGNIKQIVIYFKNDQYVDVVRRLDVLRARDNVENNTDLFLLMLDYFDSDE
jgi:hypothetical protein